MKTFMKTHMKKATHTPQLLQNKAWVVFSSSKHWDRAEIHFSCSEEF